MRKLLVGDDPHLWCIPQRRWYGDVSVNMKPCTHAATNTPTSMAKGGTSVVTPMMRMMKNGVPTAADILRLVRNLSALTKCMSMRTANQIAEVTTNVHSGECATWSMPKHTSSTSAKKLTQVCMLLHVKAATSCAKTVRTSAW